MKVFDFNVTVEAVVIFFVIVALTMLFKNQIMGAFNNLLDSSFNGLINEITEGV